MNVRVWGLWACVVAACGSNESTIAEEDETPTAVASNTPAAAEVSACGRADLAMPEDMPLDAQPAPSRKTWLAESLTTADAVVWARAEGDQWRIEEVLCGEVPNAPARFTLGAGASDFAVRFLVRTPRGYFDTGPLDRPATRQEWVALARRASPHEANELEVQETRWSITRYAQSEGRRVQHGTSVMAGDDNVNVSLTDGGDEPFSVRVFIPGSQLGAWRRIPAEGHGFSVEWEDDGGVHGYKHFLDGLQHGVSRTFYDNGQVAEEVFSRSGRRHGVSREFEEDGSIRSSLTFEDGFIPPVTEPTTEPTEARLFRDPRISYRAPHALVDRITVGMPVQQVADLLGLPVSAEMGVPFVGEPCVGPWVHVHFRSGRVSRLQDDSPLGGCLGDI